MIIKMKRMNFQFHAKKEEVLKFLLECMDKNDLTMVGVKLGKDFFCKEIKSDHDISLLYEYEIFILSRDSIAITENSYNEFITKQKGNLVIQLGEENRKILRESSMGVLAENEIDVLWKSILNKFKRKLLKGAWVINPNNGRKGYELSHRYTIGAKEAYNGGIVIGAWAGDCIYELIVEEEHHIC